MNAEEFQRLMASIDEDLRNEGVPIFAGKKQLIIRLSGEETE